MHIKIESVFTEDSGKVLIDGTVTYTGPVENTIKEEVELAHERRLLKGQPDAPVGDTDQRYYVPAEKGSEEFLILAFNYLRRHQIHLNVEFIEDD
jgi:hypothetical protein